MARSKSSQAGTLGRRDAVAMLLKHRDDALVVTGLGSPTYDVHAAGDRDDNYYLWGAMGGAALVGFGLAQAQPDKSVLVITGDGEMLMGMGSFAAIALQQPRNLAIVVLDNGLYEETGAQASPAAVADLAAIARACGIADARTVASEDELAEAAVRVARVGDGPAVRVIKIAPSEAPRVMPSREGAWLKARMRRALGLDPD
jgi:thiamine pyrophosphate-dependent acetolactate synthase large subunit-like protein